MMYQNIAMDAVTRFGTDVLHRTNFKWKPTISEVLGNIAEMDESDNEAVRKLNEFKETIK